MLLIGKPPFDGRTDKEVILHMRKGYNQEEHDENYNELEPVISADCRCFIS